MVKSKELNNFQGTKRVIGHIKGTEPGPTVIFFGGIHGNEPAGVKALQNVFAQLDKEKDTYHGQLYGIAGNLPALRMHVRFIDEDLNRIWSPPAIRDLTSAKNSETVERDQMRSLNNLIHHILDTASPPFYFVDLHTTSGETEPFIVVNDSLLNRSFTKNYPLPIILGIEEYLTGALLSHINEMGYVSFGFESGQHTDGRAITNAENFIQYTLGLVGFSRMGKMRLKTLKNALQQSNSAPRQFYEIYYQHVIKAGTMFKMIPGFVNFQSVPKGVSIALEKGRPITTKKARQLFMPLYQNKGGEGFYFIRRIPTFFLWLSKYLRKFKIDGWLSLMPGVGWASTEKEALLVDKSIAVFFAKSFFHLLGYRAKEVKGSHILFKSRERNSKMKQYQNAPWL